MKTLLVIECTTTFDWREIFKGASLEDGTSIAVEQAEWDELSLVSYSGSSGLVVTRRASKRPYAREQRTFTPQFVLMRSESKGYWGQDSTNKLMALIHSNVPSVNSTSSIYNFLQKPVIWGALREIQRRLGKEEFPLIDQTLYPSFKEMIIFPELPCVGKIGSFDAGKGKMVIRTPEASEDFKSLCAVQPAFTTIENFVDWDWDGRVQVIGPHIRVFKRQTESWKGNQGRGAIIEDLEVTPQFQRWADECRKIFGGLELFGLDFLHDKNTDKLYILELNGTACGLVHRHEQEDMRFMRDVVIAKMNNHFFPKEKVVEKHTDESNVQPEAKVLQEQIRRLIVEKIELQTQLAELSKNQ